MNFRRIKYNLIENFNVIRWSIAVILFAFTAVVSVAKYINLSDMLSITYSSLETTYMVLNDTVNIIYIYLPLYIFIVCGIMQDENFGCMEIIRSGSRRRWFTGKIITLVFYSIMFFVLLLTLNFSISNQVFEYSKVWSSDFMKMQVISGQEVMNFKIAPIFTLGMSICKVFLVYVLTGILSIIISIVNDKEVFSVAISVAVGVGITLLSFIGFGISMQRNFLIFLVQSLGIILVIAALIFMGYLVVGKIDFVIKKRS